MTEYSEYVLCGFVEDRHETVTITQRLHVVDGREPGRIVEDGLDSSECVQDFCDSHSDRSVIGILRPSTLLRQAVLHLLWGKEGEACVDRVLTNNPS